jgi:NTP pyrophosphatase (non-canonical NTP hydrolase)
MKLNEYQALARKTAIYSVEPGTFSMYPFLALAEEAGEVCGKIAKHVRDKTPFEPVREQVKLELGDVLWQLSNAAADLGFTLEDIAGANIEKLESRAKRGVLGGSGDTR